MKDLAWPSDPPRYGSVVLREFTDTDVEMVRDLATDDYVPTVGTLPHLADEEQSLAWIGRQQRRLVDLIGFSFCVADATTDEALGQIGLWPKEIEEGRATVGYSIAPRSRGRHASSEALVALTDFAWSIDRLHRLEAYVEPWNIPSIRSVERVGYRREGLLRERQVIDGVRRDMLLYARLRTDGPVG